MSRTLSSAFLQAVLANNTDEAFLLLITISHPSIDPAIRVCANAANIISRGWTFVGLPVEAELPGDEDDAPPVAVIKIDNISQDIVKKARSIRTKPEVTLEIVMESNPDFVEVSLPTFQLTKVDYDIFWVTGQLEVDDLASEPFPYAIFSPAKFRALF